MSVLEYLDPKTLTIDANVRKDNHMTPEFLASIKEQGVLQPVVAYRTEYGVHVLYGQRHPRHRRGERGEDPGFGGGFLGLTAYLARCSGDTKLLSYPS